VRQLFVPQTLGMVLAAVGLAACKSDTTGPGGAAACSLGATSPTTPVGTLVSLNPGEYQVAPGGGALQFAAAGASGAQYLVVSQLATGTPDLCSGFRTASALRLAPEVPAARRFHDMLRAREHELALAARGSGSLRAAPAASPPPVVGTQRNFRVCSTITCSSLATVAATAQFVGAHLAVFIDDSAPAGGFSGADLTQFGQMFDGVLYPIDTDRFGAESDIDGNGLVIVLLTPQINRLVGKPECNTSFITGFFFGADLMPGLAPQYNNGEVFYGLAPDSGGTVSCKYPVSFLKHVLPVTFIHEFQHMISFNQHVLLRNGLDEVLWMNEGLSHLAEELGGLHYDSLAVDSTASRFWVDDLFNAYTYLLKADTIAMVTDSAPGDLEQRGGEWLFLRYLTDQFGAGLTRLLVQTSLTGVANIEAATGQTFGALLGRQALAVYLTDLPGFTAPAVLSYRHWGFRAAFASLHAQDAFDFPLAYPLRPDSAASTAILQTGTLRSGSGAYLVVTQPGGGAAFQLALRDAAGHVLPVSAGAQVAVARIR
jgi:hypothetical protein